MHDQSEPMLHSTSTNPSTGEAEEKSGDPSTTLSSEEDGQALLVKLLSNIKATADSLTTDDPESNTQTQAQSQRLSTKRSNAYLDFVFFEYLVRFVHRDGDIGESARMGVLGLFELAFSSEVDHNKMEMGSSMLKGVDRNEKRLLQDDTMEQGRISLDGYASVADLINPLSDEPITLARLQLAQHILSGQFIDVLIAGLGAVYSVLPSKVRLPPVVKVDNDRSGGKDQLVHGRIQLGDTGRAEAEADDVGVDVVMSLLDEGLQQQLWLSRAVFAFIQEILDRCTSAITMEPSTPLLPAKTHTSDNKPTDPTVSFSSVAKGLITSIEKNLYAGFLANVLYPEFLESSPIDGSATAVISYLDAMITELQVGSGSLVKLVLRYLSGLNGTTSSTESSGPSFTYSLQEFLSDCLVAGPDEDGKMNPRAWDARIAALNFVRTLSSRTCVIATDCLLRDVPDDQATLFAIDLSELQIYLNEKREVENLSENDDEVKGDQALNEKDDMDLELDIASTIGMGMVHSAIPSLSRIHSVSDRNVDLYRALLSRIDTRRRAPTSGSVVPESYLSEAYAGISRCSCFRSSLSDLSVHVHNGNQKIIAASTTLHHPHRLEPQDPFLQELLSSLRHMFSNPPMVNVALTGALSALTLCPFRNLQGWSHKETAKASDLTGMFRLPAASSPGANGSSPQEGANPFLDQGESDLPAVYLILRDLTRQVGKYREQVGNFDEQVARRRSGLMFEEGMEDAMSAMLDFVPSQANLNTPVGRPPLKGTRSSRLASTFASFLTPKKKSSRGPEEAPDSPASGTFNLEVSSADDTSTEVAAGRAVLIEALIAEEIQSGPWTPSAKRTQTGRDRDVLSIRSSSTADDVRPRGPSRLSLRQENQNNGEVQETTVSARVRLEDVLDNVIILEEFLKEIMSITAVRRTLGIDSI